MGDRRNLPLRDWSAALPARILGDNKLGLYRQCVGAAKAENVAGRVRRRIADTACCTKPWGFGSPLGRLGRHGFYGPAI
jgi:hypothetical protein